MCHGDRKWMYTHCGKIILKTSFWKCSTGILSWIFYIILVPSFLISYVTLEHILKREMKINWWRYTYNAFLLSIWLFWSLFNTVTLRSVFFTGHHPPWLKNADDAAFLNRLNHSWHWALLPTQGSCREPPSESSNGNVAKCVWSSSCLTPPPTPGLSGVRRVLSLRHRHPSWAFRSPCSWCSPSCRQATSITSGLLPPQTQQLRHHWLSVLIGRCAVHLPMQGAQVPSLIRELPPGAAKRKKRTNASYC